jgi:hypothetical protein
MEGKQLDVAYLNQDKLLDKHPGFYPRKIVILVPSETDLRTLILGLFATKTMVTSWLSTYKGIANFAFIKLNVIWKFKK